MFASAVRDRRPRRNNWSQYQAGIVIAFKPHKNNWHPSYICKVWPTCHWGNCGVDFEF